MREPVLYLGDTSLTGAAGYLAGVLTAGQIPFHYVPSDQPAEDSLLDSRRLVILSDYPAKMLSPKGHEKLSALVAEGTGLLMIGGWESFHGLGGDWDRSSLAVVLPVTVSATDDRVNCDQPALIRSVVDHPTTRGLPWRELPPGVGGFNRFEVDPKGSVILQLVRFAARWQGDECQFEELERVPLLVVGEYGRGRTAALATDVAPHWVGGLVDWGAERVVAQAEGAGEIEVGSDYARFLQQLVRWTAGMEESAEEASEVG